MDVVFRDWGTKVMHVSASRGGARLHKILVTIVGLLALMSTFIGLTAASASSNAFTSSTDVAIGSDGTSYGYLLGVSCPTTTTCVGVGYDNNSEGVTTIGTDSGAGMELDDRVGRE